MKITEIRTYCLESPLEMPFAFSQGWVRSRGATIVEVLTDAGLVGWGEALCQGLQPPEITAATIRSTLAPLSSGVDIALWDLAGKALGQPVFEYDCSAHPFREQLVDRPLRPRDGWLERPEGPGLGIEVDRAALARFSV